MSVNIRTSLNTIAVFVAVVVSNSMANASSIDEIDTAGWFIQEGVQSFYAIYEEWPASWNDVVDAQLVQVELVSLSGKAVDPDDKSLDFAWDMQYILQAEGTSPQIALRLSDEDSRTHMYEIFPVKSYAERFGERDNPDIQSALLNENRLKQWAISGMLFRSLTLHLAQFDEYPETFEDFIGCGVTCIDSSSINPLTQDPFKGDGSPNDILFYPKVDPDTDEILGIVILAVDEAGNTPWKFTY